MQDAVASPSPRTGIQAIARAGGVLRALEAAPAGLALGELATAVGLPKSTVHRLVQALADEDLVRTGAGGRIRLGPGLARLGAAAHDALADTLRHPLQDLRRDLDETADLAVLDGASVRFIDQAPAPHRLRAVSAVGSAFPLHCTANGKALLSGLTDDAIRDLLPAQLTRFTGTTITTRAALLGELDAVRRTGVAFDREEHTDGISAVAALVTDGSGPVAAMSVPVPTQRFTGNEARYAAAVRAAADAASALLAG